MKHLFDKFWHKTLGVPYTLSVREYRTVRKAKHTLVFLHGIGSSGAAWSGVVSRLVNQPVNIVVLDLLGFGDSPRPAWAKYDAKTQARAVNKTVALKIRTRSAVLVGHSMGSLVAIECAKRSRRYSGLLLASPPLYDDKTDKYLPDRDRQLVKLYDMMTRHPKRIVKISAIARKYGLIGHAFDVTESTVGEYIAALKAAIINQTSLVDIKLLKLPIRIVYGTLDPLVIGSHIRSLNKERSNVTVKSFLGSHDVEGRYVTVIIKYINEFLAELTRR